MKVCMISYSFYESDTRILQYTAALTERGDEVDVISLGGTGLPSFEVLREVRVFRVLRRSLNERRPWQYLLRILLFMVRAAWEVGRRHLARRYDVIHVHSVPDFLVFAAVIPKLTGARVVLDIHDILPELYASKFHLSTKTPLYRALLMCERMSAAFADHVIVANEIWRKRLIERSVSEQKCTAIRNYPDPKLFTPRRRTATNTRFRILYPGTLNHHQGLDIAIRAFALIASQIPEAEFAIYGYGAERNALMALRDQLGLRDQVRIEDYIPVSEIATIMADADLAVVPKRVTTGFGNEAASTKIMEFMALGVPVIVSRTRIDTLYYGDDAVMFVEPENEQALADAMRRMWREPELRDSYRKSGLQYIENHTWNRKKEAYFALLGSPTGANATSAEDEPHA